MKNILLVVCLLLMAACAPSPAQVFQAQGTVRNVWCVEDICRVTFEHETGELQELQFFEAVPLWTGLHCIIKYHDFEGSQYDKLDSVARLN